MLSRQGARQCFSAGLTFVTVALLLNEVSVSRTSTFPGEDSLSGVTGGFFSVTGAQAAEVCTEQGSCRGVEDEELSTERDEETGTGRFRALVDLVTRPVKVIDFGKARDRREFKKKCKRFADVFAPGGTATTSSFAKKPEECLAPCLAANPPVERVPVIFRGSHFATDWDLWEVARDPSLLLKDPKFVTDGETTEEKNLPGISFGLHSEPVFNMQWKGAPLKTHRAEHLYEEKNQTFPDFVKLWKASGFSAALLGDTVGADDALAAMNDMEESFGAEVARSISGKFVYWKVKTTKYVADMMEPNACLWAEPGPRPEGGFESNVWISGAGTTQSMHFDINHNMFSHVAGEKRVVLCPPTAAQFLGMYPRTHASFHQTMAEPWSNGSIDVQRFPRVLELEGDDSPCVMAYLRAGDILYIPPLWLHRVEALTPSISVAAWSESENFVSMQAIPQWFWFLSVFPLPERINGTVQLGNGPDRAKIDMKKVVPWLRLVLGMSVCAEGGGLRTDTIPLGSLSKSAVEELMTVTSDRATTAACADTVTEWLSEYWETRWRALGDEVASTPMVGTPCGLDEPSLDEEDINIADKELIKTAWNYDGASGIQRILLGDIVDNVLTHVAGEDHVRYFIRECLAIPPKRAAKGKKGR